MDGSFLKVAIVIYLGLIACGLGYAVAFHPWAMRRVARRYDVVPVGYVDGDVEKLIGIQGRSFAWGMADFEDASLWALRGGVRHTISPDEVWALAETGRLRWCSDGLLPNTGLSNFSAFVGDTKGSKAMRAAVQRLALRDQMRLGLLGATLLSMMFVMAYIGSTAV
jgi:hypothetical protein